MINDLKKVPLASKFSFLLDELHRQGLLVGVGDILKVHRYFTTLWEWEERPLSIIDLKVQLAALVCQNPQQQKLFYEWFDEWAIVIERRTENLIAQLEPLETTKQEPLTKNTENVDKPIEIPPPQPPIIPQNTGVMQDTFTPVPSLKKRTGPINIQLTFPQNPIRFWNLAEFDDVLPILREKKWVESTEWDIKASIMQTIQSGGVPKFVSKQKRQTPDYLMLIEQQSNRDHLAAFYADLAEELRSRDLNVSFYYYGITPALCWRERSDPRTHVSLEQLQGEYADARLFIVGNAETLLKPTELEPSAVAVSIWETWKETAILSPRGTNDWGRAELAIGQLFPVIPANGRGFQSLNKQWHGTEHYTPTYWQINNPEPRTPNVADFTLSERPKRENSEGSPSLPYWKTPTPDEVSQLNSLYFYLRDGGYRWLCATTLYPEIYYELTRLYADEVIAKKQNLSEWEQNRLWGDALRLLLRLDWFRKGQIPTHWRGLLRADFSIERALALNNPQFTQSVKEVRRQLLEVLKLPENTEGVPEDSYAAANQAFTQVWIESEMANNLAGIPEKMEELQISMLDIEDAVGQQLWFVEGQKLEQKKNSGGIKTLHTLIIGIDKYPIKQHELLGCVNDASAIANYLEEFAHSGGMVYNEKRLFDADVTRKKVLAGFNHFEAAKNGDVCVFYFAGHGSTMKAPIEFWDNPDGLSDTLVCFDSRTGQTESRDLADKEICHLIYKATEDKDIHFLFITDCSHSGDNTRKLSSDSNIRTRTLETCPTSPRTVKEYEGIKEWTDFQPSPSNYIHLSAAQQDETANELKISGISHGVFTYSLIETLQQTLNSINYSELVSPLRIKVRNRVQNQTPSCTAYGNNAGALMKQLFLERSQARPTTFLVSHRDNSWRVNAGSVNRLPIEGGTEFQLENGMKTVTTQVLYNFSKVDLELPPSSAVFSAILTSPISIISNRFRLAISSDSDAQGAKYLSNYLQERGDADLQLAGNEYDADYVARLYDGALRLTMINQTQPLFKPVNGYTDNAVEEFLNRSVSVARWRNKLELSNPTIDISDKDIEIQFYNSEGKPIEELIFRQPNKDMEVNIQISITNRSSIPLHISVVYFGHDFSVSNQFLRGQSLNPNQTAWVEYDSEKNIPLFVPLEYLAWGVNEVEEYFKIFVSKDKIDTDSLNQDGLPLDTRNIGTQRAVQYNQKAFSLGNWRTFERSYRLISSFSGVSFSEKREVKFGNIRMIAPNGFSSKIGFTTTVEAKRIPEFNMANQRFGNYLTPVPIIEGMANCPIVDVIEIFDVIGTVSKENPLRIELLVNMKDVVPMGYDGEKGIFIPIGNQNTEGVIFIEQLPSPTPTNSKSGASFKIFFRRAIMSVDGDSQEQQITVDESASKKIPLSIKSQKGRLLYDFPKNMILGQEYRCVVRIAYDDEKLLGNFNDAAFTFNAVQKDILITDEMVVTLLSTNEVASFKINWSTDVHQTITKDSFTEWFFTVEPLFENQQTLALKITTIEIIEGKEHRKEIVLEEMIDVTRLVEGKKAIINTESLNVYHEPNTNARVIGSRVRGTDVLVFDEKDNWALIGDNMWVQVDFLGIKVKGIDEQTKEQMQDLIDRGRLDKVLEALGGWADVGSDKELKNAIFLKGSEYNALRKDENLGFLTHLEADVRRNKITEAILSLIDTEGGDKIMSFKDPSVPAIDFSVSINSDRKTILFMGATSPYTSKVQIEIEHSRIAAELHDKFNSKVAKFMSSSEIPKLIVASKPYIIHFSGQLKENEADVTSQNSDKHGIVIFDNDKRKMKMLQDNQLEYLFRTVVNNFKIPIEVVLFSSCYSESQAKVLSKYIPYVVGSSSFLKEQIAIAFAAGFYYGIASGQTIEKSFLQGKIQAVLEDSSADKLIVLYKNGELIEGSNAEIAYVLIDLPVDMNLGNEVSCRVYIGFDKEKLLQQQTIYGNNQIEEIKTSEIVGIELLEKVEKKTEDKTQQLNFDITEYTNREQTIFRLELTEWIFEIKPNRAGEFALIFSIGYVNSQNEYVKAASFDREIEVHGNDKS